MDPSFDAWLSTQVAATPTEQQRMRLVTMVLNLTAGTALEPKAYERMLLDQFVRGSLTIDQVLARLP